MRVLGLDMATRTGYAFIDTESPCRVSGYNDYGKPGTPLPMRLLLFQDSLSGMIGLYDPSVIVYEIAHHRGGPATRSGLGMETILIVTAMKRMVPVHGVHSMTLKKFATGSGKATKDQMVALASGYDKFGRIADDNEADAVHLAKWGVKNVVIDEGGKVQITGKRVSTKKKGCK